jgi:hypothetical protein
MTDPDSIAPLDAEFIDRIVEGGLTPIELRRAIDRLDRDPEGWKRCSLAFLEAQCWRESFRALEAPARIGVAAPSPSGTTGRFGRKSREWRRVAIAAGMAAAAFAMGWFAHPDRSPTQVQHGPTSPALAIATHQDTLTPRVQVQETEDPTEPAGEFVRHPEPEHFRAGPGGSVVAAPILAGPGIGEQGLGDGRPRLSEHQLALLERQGYQVDQRRRIVIATLDDGRRVTLPIDQVKVRYTGNDPL